MILYIIAWLFTWVGSVMLWYNLEGELFLGEALMFLLFAPIFLIFFIIFKINQIRIL